MDFCLVLYVFTNIVTFLSLEVTWSEFSSFLSVEMPVDHDDEGWGCQIWNNFIFHQFLSYQSSFAYDNHPLLSHLLD